MRTSSGLASAIKCNPVSEGKDEERGWGRGKGGRKERKREKRREKGGVKGEVSTTVSQLLVGRITKG